MCDLLQPKEWIYVNWLQGNFYWFMEYPDVMKGGEPARCGWRYYRVSPDYSTLEFVIGPNQDAGHKIKSEPREVREHHRTVRLRLSDGVLLDADAKISDVNKVPVHPFCDALIKRGDAKGFQASALSRLNFRVAKSIDFWESPSQQGGPHEQEVCRAAYG